MWSKGTPFIDVLEYTILVLLYAVSSVATVTWHLMTVLVALNTHSEANLESSLSKYWKVAY
jgi:hypothetical protein